MNLRSRNFLVVVSLVLLLCVGGVGIAVASPDGDDDPGYNASGSTFGTQYSLLDPDRTTADEPELLEGSHPAITQDTSADGDGSSVTVSLIDKNSFGGQRIFIGSPGSSVQLQRYDADGKPVATFGNQENEAGVAVNESPDLPGYATEVLDVRVLSDGTIRVVFRADVGEHYPSISESSSSGDLLWVVDYDADGEPTSTQQSYEAPDDTDCQEQEGRVRGNIIVNPGTENTDYEATLNAARVDPTSGAVSALWTCESVTTFTEGGDDDGDDGDDTGGGLARPRGNAGDNHSTVYVSLYADPTFSQETDHTTVPTFSGPAYGEDLELGPGGDPYALTGSPTANFYFDRQVRGGPGEYSQVFHFSIEAGPGGFEPQTRRPKGDPPQAQVVSEEPVNGSSPSDLASLPVDLAVDSQGRPIVWREDNTSEDESDWLISRLTPGLDLDEGWGDGGTATVAKEDLAPAFSARNGAAFNERVLQSLTVRPDDRVLATGEQEQDWMVAGRAEGTRGNNEDPEPIQSSVAIIAGLTNTGATDQGFGADGFRLFDFAVPGSTDDGNEVYGADFDAIGEPKLQTDGKVLVPHVSAVRTESDNEPPARTSKITPPPSNEPGLRSYVGVTRFAIAAPGSSGTTGNSNPGTGRPSAARRVTPSSTRIRCGRRVISLVRADVRGSKIRLMGLVGSKLYGKKVTIETDPTAVKGSAYTKTTTVKASKSGAFAATVAAPKRSQYKTVRYRAKSGGATSPVLKLPQSLTSRSVKSAKGTITVKGLVKRSVLGKRNDVKIRRLVCGRYRTVAVVKPAADGSYKATFKATKIRGVSFYRAEVKVQVRPGSKKYAIQYARAIAIRTTAQTG